MPKCHQFTKEQYHEVMNLLQKTQKANLHRKLEVLQLRMEGYKEQEIANITKYSKSRVNALIGIYANKGIAYFEKEHRLSGNHRNLSVEEEAALLAPLQEAAKKGILLETSELKAAYDEKCGHKSGSGTIYMVLRRHGWRKVMPRSGHPKKADKEAIEASKKLTPDTEKR
jgi:transposase